MSPENCLFQNGWGVSGFSWDVEISKNVIATISARKIQIIPSFMTISDSFKEVAGQLP